MTKAELIEALLSSFDDERRKEIDAAWAQEAEARLDAYEAGTIQARPAGEVLAAIERESRK